MTSRRRRISVSLLLSVTIFTALPFILLLASIGLRGDPLTLPSAPNPLITITAEGLDFEAPIILAQGWTTLRFKNESSMTHFALLERLPDDKGIEDHQQEVAPLFQQGLALIMDGKPETAAERFEQLPDWFEEVEFVGGPGLVAPGRTAQSTVQLEPGTYLIECYVKTNGVFHSYNPMPNSYGMVRQFTVREGATQASEPEPSLELALSKKEGIKRIDEVPLRPGRHTVAVHFKDQMRHQNAVGHDVHLAKLDPSTRLDTLAAWMDWRQPHGLETPAPVSFVGGTNEMPAGETAYFTVNLDPGRYVWVAEVPNPDAKGMMKPFSVPPEEEITSRGEN